MMEANKKYFLFFIRYSVPPSFHEKIAGIINIQTVATDFIIAPTHPPATGPRNPTKGALINILKIAGFNPNIIQHNIHGIATRSILIDHGVTRIGGRI